MLEKFEKQIAFLKKNLRWVRIAVQIIFFILAPALFSQAFTGVKNIFTQLGKGQPVAWSGFTLCLVLLCFFTILFGRIFCGWACAFGALNDWVYQISCFIQKKCKRKLPAVPEKAVRILQKMKFVTLALIAILCFVGASSIVTIISPWTVFALITALNLRFTSYILATIFLLILIVGMAFHERFFCQFFCPLGAVFSLLPQVKVLGIGRDSTNCINGCKACSRACPVGIKLGDEPISDGECIACGRCATKCPKGNISVENLPDFHRRNSQSEI